MRIFGKIQYIYINKEIVMKKPILNEQIIKMRKMMGLNENHMDDMSNAKSNAKQQHDFYQDAIDYVGGKVEWNKLSGNEKDSVLADMEKDWDRSRNMGESNDPKEKMVSFDDLLAQDTDGMSPEDQAMIDAHDEEEANKYASKNYDDVESGAIDEDWGSSDQGYMNKTIHTDLNEPTEFNLGMYDDLKNAAEEAVDHFWDDWEEYNTDKEGLVMKAMKLYLRRYFPDWYEKASKMFA